MQTGNREMELAEERVEQERQSAIARASAALNRAGSAVCCYCAEPIEPKRRAALPSARTCMECAHGATERGNEK